MQGCGCDVLVQTECQMEEGCLDLIVATLAKSASYVAVNCSSLCSFFLLCIDCVIINGHT